MSVAPDYWRKAKRALARQDPVMAGIMRAHPKVAIARRGEAFSTLARAIVGQQISVKAAQTVWEPGVSVDGVRRSSFALCSTSASAAALNQCASSRGETSWAASMRRVNRVGWGLDFGDISR